MNLKKINNIAIKTAILAIPFELFGLGIAQTYLAPSYIIQFIFLFTVFFYLKKKKKRNALYTLFCLILLIIINGLLTYEQLDVNRYVINSFTFLSLLLLCIKNYILRLKINQQDFFCFFRYSVFLCAFFIYLQLGIQIFLRFNFLHYIERYTLSGRSYASFATRYQGLMVEPSYAAYVIACLLTYEICVFFSLNQFLSFKSNCQKIIQIIFLIGAIVLTGSSHILTVVVALSFVLIIHYQKMINSIILNPRKIITGFVLFCVVALISTAIFANSIDVEGLTGRVTLDEDNLSSLSWTRGYENARESLKLNPLFGFGLGNNHRAANYSQAQSDAQRQLEKYHLSRLNINDSFSLLFRLLSEGGLTITFYLLFFVVLLIIKSINKTKNVYIPINSLSAKQQKQALFDDRSKNFLYVPFLVAVLGALLKEPTYCNYMIPITILFL